ncbi:hypothetical protein [uncultured Roseibium sp.]|uniref:hypothetical protein n=1 Tax=uncultured Roseibium sp. TaxID=1936171 RepID=UPI00261C91E3|nr:hypothetical protein [uncultured Roseibium sp.]
MTEKGKDMNRMSQEALEKRLIDAEVRINQMDIPLLRANIDRIVICEVLKRIMPASISREDVAKAATEACEDLRTTKQRGTTVDGVLEEALDTFFKG